MQRILWTISSVLAAVGITAAAVVAPLYGMSFKAGAAHAAFRVSPNAPKPLPRKSAQGEG